MVATAVALAGLAGCGGGAGKPDVVATKTVRGPGFRVSVPVAWSAERGPELVTAAPAEGATSLVSVTVINLVKPYRPALWDEVVGELDTVAGRLAAGLDGEVDVSRTVRVAGRRARQYEIGYTRDRSDLRQRVTFVLAGKREFQLLCRWDSAQAEPEACKLLTGTFSLT
jgi:hypothetical protein